MRNYNCYTIIMNVTLKGIVGEIDLGHFTKK